MEVIRQLFLQTNVLKLVVLVTHHKEQRPHLAHNLVVRHLHPLPQKPFQIQQKKLNQYLLILGF